MNSPVGTRPTRSRGRPKKEESSEEEFQSDESELEDNDEYGGQDDGRRKNRGRRSTAASILSKQRKDGKKPQAKNGKKTRGRPKKQETSSEEEFQSSDHSESEEEYHDESSSGEDNGGRKSGKRTMAASRSTRGTKRKAKPAPTRSYANRNKNRKHENSSDEELSSSGDEQPVSRQSKRRKVQTRKAATTNRRRRSIQESSESASEHGSDDDDSNQLETPNRSRRVSTPSTAGSRSRRASAQKALASLSKFQEEDDDDDENLIPKSFRKKNQDDEEFSVNEEDGNDDENESVGGLDEEDEDNILEKPDHSEDENIVGVVNDDEIGSAEESDEDNTESHPHRSPHSNFVHQSPARVAKNSILQDHEDEDEDDSESDEKPSSSPPCMPACPSERDAITDEELPKKHVCFFSPDGKSRQCFALATLHKITTNAVCQQIRQEQTTGRVVQTFLQPPHFRSAMSDDLLDQIASRFGRDALDIHGDFYKPRPKEQCNITSAEDSDSDSDPPDVFVQQVRNYVRDQMGSCDLYVCPLCFTFARRKFKKKPRIESDADETETDSTLFQNYIDVRPSDPLVVLSSLDSKYEDAFLMASAFCFPKVSKLKQHLRDDHGVSTKNIEGNDLYKSHQIRTTDGLLQRFLKSEFRGRASQGDMQRYWVSRALHTDGTAVWRC